MLALVCGDRYFVGFRAFRSNQTPTIQNPKSAAKSMLPDSACGFDVLSPCVDEWMRLLKVRKAAKMQFIS